MEDGDTYRLPIFSLDCLKASPTPSPSALGRPGCLGMQRLGYYKQVPIYTGMGIPARGRGFKFANHKDGDQPLAQRVIPAFVLLQRKLSKAQCCKNEQRLWVGVRLPLALLLTRWSVFVGYPAAAGLTDVYCWSRV